jgi:hypothetical protein
MTLYKINMTINFWLWRLLFLFFANTEFQEISQARVRAEILFQNRLVLFCLYFEILKALQLDMTVNAKIRRW